VIYPSVACGGNKRTQSLSSKRDRKGTASRHTSPSGHGKKLFVDSRREGEGFISRFRGRLIAVLSLRPFSLSMEPCSFDGSLGTLLIFVPGPPGRTLRSASASFPSPAAGRLEIDDPNGNETGHSNRSIDRSRRVFDAWRSNGHGLTSSSLGGTGEYNPLLGKQRVDPIDYCAPSKAVLAASASAGEMSFVRSNSEMT
jgi:hypothetical protein